MLVDSHCHIDLPELAANLPQVLGLMHDNDVGCVMCIGVTLEDFPRVRSLAESNRTIFASVGVHPETTDVREPSIADLVVLAQHPKVIAIGETGLDYYWHKDAPEWQRKLITDPQTSGGLLIACAPGAVEAVQAAIVEAQGEPGVVIGEMQAGVARVVVR